MCNSVARTVMGRATISTVRLSFLPNNIDQYETMIFTDNDKFVDYCDKHSTLDEARQGHIHAIQYLLTGKREQDDNNNDNQ